MAIKIRIESVPAGTKLKQDEAVFNPGNIDDALLTPQAIIVNSVSMADVVSIKKVIALTTQGTLTDSFGKDYTPLATRIDETWSYAGN